MSLDRQDWCCPYRHLHRTLDINVKLAIQPDSPLHQGAFEESRKAEGMEAEEHVALGIVATDHSRDLPSRRARCCCYRDLCNKVNDRTTSEIRLDDPMLTFQVHWHGFHTKQLYRNALAAFYLDENIGFSPHLRLETLLEKPIGGRCPLFEKTCE